MPNQPYILICNDDGIHAPGIHALAAEIAKIAEVVIVAPHMERSAFSHCLTVSRPLRITKLNPCAYAQDLYEVDGTPVDCIKIALDTILPRKPDWILSGINRGGNLGTDTLYSGTVAAAMEGAIQGYPAIAFSAHGPGKKEMHYQTSAKVARLLLEHRQDLPLPTGSMLNVNIPACDFEELRGIKTSSCGVRVYDDHYWRKEDPRGLPYYWIGPDAHKFKPIPGSDCNTLSENYVSLSVLKPDLLDSAANAAMDSYTANRLEKYF